MNNLRYLVCLGLVLIWAQIASAENTSAALERARGAELAAAVGHYARARSLLLAAVREFDRGMQMADPQALLNTKEWRTTLIDRAHDLEKILDPQPVITEKGVRFEPDPRLSGGQK
ncbi:MAG: hypothetical protein D6719_02645 [Candidatus Dadabacteria bacterium]|nr:MAG: hypothetical protein D6719_02645 [Candidatus Dadabacteria bacterium]